MDRRWPYALGALVSVLALAACSAPPATPAATGSPTPPATRSTPSPRPSAQQSSPATTPAVRLQSAYRRTIQAVLPSVVLIQTSEDLGSGVVFDDSGDIVTNDHVVGSATSFHVRPYGSVKDLTAHLVGAYPPDDLAVIRVNNPSGLKPATFADSSKVRVGDIVLAVGNPLGLSSSVTNGIVSAVGRTVNEPQGQGSPGATLPDTIQTSAAINPGNSGGALVDLQAQVIGIPTLAATDQQEGGAAPGIGFAISSNIVKDIASQLVAHGKVTSSHRAALGVRVTTVAGRSGQPVGVGIVQVEPHGAAAGAGLSAGEIIVAINGKQTPTEQVLSDILANLEPGDKANVTVRTPDGGKNTVRVTLGSLPG